MVVDQKENCLTGLCMGVRGGQGNSGKENRRRTQGRPLSFGFGHRGMTGPVLELEE